MVRMLTAGRAERCSKYWGVSAAWSPGHYGLAREATLDGA